MTVEMGCLIDFAIPVVVSRAVAPSNFLRPNDTLYHCRRATL